MSTTFSVFPGNDYIPIYYDILKQTQSELNKFVNRYVEQCTELSIVLKLKCKSDDRDIMFNMSDPFKWSDDHYLWIQVKGLEGGSDGYFWENDEIDEEYWHEEIIPAEGNKQLQKKYNQCISIGYHWHFRRSLGQPGLINVLYGTISGVLARITEGIIFSDDSAWDYERMPIAGIQFLESYLHPDNELSEESKNHAKLILSWVAKEIKEINA